MLAIIIAAVEKRKPGTISYTSNKPPSRRFHTSTVTPPSNPYPGPVYESEIDFTYLPFVEAGR